MKYSKSGATKAIKPPERTDTKLSITNFLYRDQPVVGPFCLFPNFYVASLVKRVFKRQPRISIEHHIGVRCVAFENWFQKCKNRFCFFFFLTCILKFRSSSFLWNIAYCHAQIASKKNEHEEDFSSFQ